MAKQDNLLSVQEARTRILERFTPLAGEEVALRDAPGRILAEDMEARISLPPFGNSSMDGFAVISAATEGAAEQNPVRLTIDQIIAAGSYSDVAVRSGGCARIMTGAPLPPEADAVVPFEDVIEEDGAILLTRRVDLGACVRPRGRDVVHGTAVLDAGTEIGAAQIALLAALGHATIRVRTQPIVAILSTGDELVAPGASLGPGQIYNSNTPMLEAAVREAGGIPRAIATVRDDPEAIANSLDEARACHLLLTSGGASVGDFDHMRTVLGARGRLDFWRVRLRPGKPLLFGTIDSVPLIGLPGNPTSAMVTFELFVRPAIRRLLGTSPMRPQIEVEVDEPIENRGGRRTYARVKLRYLNGGFHASLSGGQDSAMLVPLAHADGLLEIPEDITELRVGDKATVQVWRLPPPERMLYHHSGA